MKQISLLFLETSIFFFSSVNIFTGNGNNNFTKPYTHKKFDTNNKTKRTYTTINEINSNPEIKKHYNYNNNTYNNNTYNNNYYPNQMQYNPNQISYNQNQNIFPSNEIYNKTQMIPLNYNYNYSPEMINRNICNTINNINDTRKIQHGYNTNQDKNQRYSNNNIGTIITKEDYNTQHEPILESKGETPETEEENILIKYNVDDPKNQIPAIRSSAYVTRYNNGGNNRRGCCRIKNLKIEKNTVDMTKAKNNINNEIEKTIIEKFKNITFNIELKNEEVDDIRNLVFGDIYKGDSNSDKEVKKVEEIKEKKKKNKKKLKEEKEKEIKRKIIAAKFDIANFCNNKINNPDNEESVIILFKEFIESLGGELKNLKKNDNIDEKELNKDNKDNIVKEIFEEYDEYTKNIITDNNFIRKKYKEFIESKINEKLGELSKSKEKNNPSDGKGKDEKDKYEKLLEAFNCIKNKTLGNSEAKKNDIKNFAEYIRKQLVEDIIEKVKYKVSKKGKKEGSGNTNKEHKEIVIGTRTN